MSFPFPLLTESQAKVLKERPSSLHLSLDQVFIIFTCLITKLITIIIFIDPTKERGL